MDTSWRRSVFRRSFPTLFLGALLLCSAEIWFSAEAAAEKGAGGEEKYRRAATLKGLALAEMEEGNYGRATEYLEELALLLPENLLPRVNLAICYFQTNRPSDARREIDKARAQAPRNPQMLFALAKILEAESDSEELWLEVVEHFASVHPYDPRPPYLLAQGLLRRSDAAGAVPLLMEAIDLDPENLVLLLELLLAAASAGLLDEAADALDAVDDRLGGFDETAAPFALRLRRAVAERRSAALKPPSQVLLNVLRPSEPYQAGLDRLVGRRRPAAQLFPQLDFDPPLPRIVRGGQDIPIRFVRTSVSGGLDLAAEVRAVVAERSPGREGWLILAPDGAYRLAAREGAFTASKLPLEPPGRGLLLSFDFDQDQRGDLVSADALAGVHLHRGREDGSFEPGVRVLAPESSAGLLAITALDLDHEGDLDLFVARQGRPDLYLQNSGDGTWEEKAAALGLAGGGRTTLGATSADFDEDGDLDLVVLYADASPRLYLNPRSGSFADVSQRWGLDAVPASAGVRAADFNQDGAFDLLFWGASGGTLLLNRAGRAFEPAALGEDLSGSPWSAAAVSDFDNDGDLDFAAALEGATLFARNRGGKFVVDPEVALPEAAARSFRTGDFDEDGDLDLLALTAAGLELWRNEGGNRNHWLRLSLRGKNDNNAKNNTQGLFAKIEARVAGSYQAILGNGGVNHLGLGREREVEVVRVVWTNGLPQTFRRVAGDRTLVEEQVLKGSCPFLYTWNGDAFVFHTDLLWRSPLGMVGDDGRPAPHRSARDYVLIAGEALAEVDGELWLQITGELWETVYLDRVELLAIDHPASAELVVDEKFTPPPYPREAPLHWLKEARPPSAAIDHAGRDVLAEVARRDGIYVDGLPLGRYQGMTEGHHLELSFPAVPAGERLRLVLWGWIFPTDTTINVAISQNAHLVKRPPRLDLLEPDGTWRTLVAFLGLPNGKRKAVVTELTGQLPPGRVTLRIAGNLQIYWDAALLAVGDPEPRHEIGRPALTRADLHYRGFSRLYRDSSAGPHLFDYRDVGLEPPFREMNGRYTRYGPVDELLRAAEDCYVVLAAGDELTLRFQAGPPPPPTWRRDYVLFSDGWVKDADFHTAHSQSVEPWPYHAMESYPDLPEHRLPTSGRRCLERYQTRQVSDERFRRGLAPRPSPGRNFNELDR